MSTKRTDRRRATNRILEHKLPTCVATGLDRYRDRHQAHHGAAARGAHDRWHHLTAFACPDCRGYHLERLPQHHLRAVGPMTTARSKGHRPPRFLLVDIENLVAGQSTHDEIRSLWKTVTRRLQLTSDDHIVIGANRYVATRYSATLAGNNITWVVGANVPDAADRALLAAVNLHQIASKYGEIVILSGDHAFTNLAHRAKLRGLRVHVVTTTTPQRPTALSRALATEAEQVTRIRLPKPNTTSGGRAA